MYNRWCIQKESLKHQFIPGSWPIAMALSLLPIAIAWQAWGNMCSCWSSPLLSRSCSINERIKTAAQEKACWVVPPTNWCSIFPHRWKWLHLSNNQEEEAGKMHRWAGRTFARTINNICITSATQVESGASWQKLHLMSSSTGLARASQVTSHLLPL